MNEEAYNNNMTALASSYLRGFDLVELDFLVTRDGYVTCGYTWEAEGWEGRVPLHNEFVLKVGRKRCTLSEVYSWLKVNGGVRIVIDAKESPTFVWSYIAKNYPDVIDRFIPQAYDLSDIYLLQKLGYEDIYLTLYRYKSHKVWPAIESLLNCESDIRALVVQHKSDILSAELSSALHLCGILLFVYTVNSSYRVEELRSSFDVDGVYTDHLDVQISGNKIGKNQAD